VARAVGLKLKYLSHNARFGSRTAVFTGLKTLLLSPLITDIENEFSDFSETTSAFRAAADINSPVLKGLKSAMNGLSPDHVKDLYRSRKNSQGYIESDKILSKNKTKV